MIQWDSNEKNLNGLIGTNRVSWTVFDDGRYKVYKDFKGRIV